MAEQSLFAGPTVRRIRRREGMTQAAMATTLGISSSYLNLIERNQRPLSARLLLAMAQHFDFDPRSLGSHEEAGGVDGLRRRLTDTLFDDLAIDRDEVVEWLNAAPQAAVAFARLYDRAGSSREGEARDSRLLARREIERWRNHFADLDAAAEELADELRLSEGEIGAAMAERLRRRHQLSLRILPASVMPDHLRRLDLHARQLQLAEMLDPASRTFQIAVQLAQLEQRDAVRALVDGAGLADRAAQRLVQRHLFAYFAAALIMPYGRFLRACETSGYDIPLLQRRFGVGFEQLAHRLTTLQRVGQRGLPFFMLRIDRAGQISKRFAGASGAVFFESPASCPLWSAHAAFERAGRMVVEQVALEDGTRWFSLARTVQASGASRGGQADFVVVLGLEASLAGQLAAARGQSLRAEDATPIGPGCARCHRPACMQRSLPPLGASLQFDDRALGLTPFGFSG
ncbi:short-chain fatty acyl-CoA regulator family protein [Novosphingobium sp. Gsoil 351]|uniref:helix-turn-helix domain-containing protein n=1 Tax=Novosphingobium sp. Gsoil 351 TaxID=2675225 RepID=UPI0012B492C9|nr:helix-turn-helix transcriptional regulator [Novosphingobium sp. Gsoil 351]QGN53414.1 ImmA/IrrE family metallo-endopeptidase [Novosphingobium sp. Gsoil 351]